MTLSTHVLDATGGKPARGLREVMTEAGLTPYVKTTGSRGVHVFAPVRARLEFLEVRHAVIGLARELERRLPDLVTTAWWKEERGERIFVDFNQATRDRTLAAAWSPRILPGAPVSTSLDWEELDADIEPGDMIARHGKWVTVERIDVDKSIPMGWLHIDDERVEHAWKAVVTYADGTSQDCSTNSILRG